MYFIFLFLPDINRCFKSILLILSGRNFSAFLEAKLLSNLGLSARPLKFLKKIIAALHFYMESDEVFLYFSFDQFKHIFLKLQSHGEQYQSSIQRDLSVQIHTQTIDKHPVTFIHIRISLSVGNNYYFYVQYKF